MPCELTGLLGSEEALFYSPTDIQQMEFLIVSNQPSPVQPEAWIYWQHPCLPNPPLNF